MSNANLCQHFPNMYLKFGTPFFSVFILLKTQIWNHSYLLYQDKLILLILK